MGTFQHFPALPEERVLASFFFDLPGACSILLDVVLFQAKASKSPAHQKASPAHSSNPASTPPQVMVSRPLLSAPGAPVAKKRSPEASRQSVISSTSNPGDRTGDYAPLSPYQNGMLPPRRGPHVLYGKSTPSVSNRCFSKTGSPKRGGPRLPDLQGMHPGHAPARQHSPGAFSAGQESWTLDENR